MGGAKSTLKNIEKPVSIDELYNNIKYKNNKCFTFIARENRDYTKYNNTYLGKLLSVEYRGYHDDQQLYAWFEIMPDKIDGIPKDAEYGVFITDKNKENQKQNKFQQVECPTPHKGGRRTNKKRKNKYKKNQLRITRRFIRAK